MSYRTAGTAVAHCHKASSRIPSIYQRGEVFPQVAIKGRRERPVIIPAFGGPEISQSFHPVRWAVLAGVGLPVLLLIASVTLPGQNEVARMLARVARYVVACEAILLVIVAAAGFLYERNASRRDAELYRPAGRLIDIGGYKLHIH
jgi:hypothetical protein